MKEIYEIALSLVKGVGPATHRKIVENLGSAEEFFSLTKKELSTLKIKKFSKEKLIYEVKRAVAKNRKLGVKFLCYGDENYPDNLKNINKPPPFLFYVGDISIINNRKKLGVVGTRNMTAYGKSVTENVVKEAVNDDVVIVSGLAGGIDSVAHKTTLQHKGKTVAVIGSGFMYQYPSTNSKLYHDIVEFGGVIISEFLPEEKPYGKNFPRRNRIVAGVSDCIAVIESKIKGGSLITANYALELNREVFATPGSIFNEQSQGCNKLIYDGASMINRGYEDISEVMGWNCDIITKKSEDQNLFSINQTFQNIKTVNDIIKNDIIELDNKEDDKIYQFIKKNNGIHIDELVKKIGIMHSKLLSKLTILELKGFIEVLPGMKYRVV